MEQFHRAIVDLLVQACGKTEVELEKALEIPSKPELGDRALPCFRWAKEERTSPENLAARWKDSLSQCSLPNEIEKVAVMGGYVNFFFRKSALAHSVLTEIHRQPGQFGFLKYEVPPIIVIEFSSPNIAKPFSIGHLRSTNIGATLSRIFQARGWTVVSLNHLGDWGTQFGKLMVAYRRWGTAEMLSEEPMMALYQLYVRYHKEEPNDPTLIEEARVWFARLEQGDVEAKELWEWFRELTLRELKRLYQILSVDFDHYWGESFYVKRLPALFKELNKKRLLQESEEATIVDLEPYGLPPCLVKKKDESSLYLTRDLAAAMYRYGQFKFDRMLYVVGAPQKLHFEQVFKVLELMGYSWVNRLEHIMFGHISFGEDTMSTRKGHVVFLADVLQRATDIAKKVIHEKNPELENQEEVAKQVGLGAILFADLSAKRMKDVRFSWEEILTFDGDTGPYLQYTLVRMHSVLRKHSHPVDEKAKTDLLESHEEAALIRELSFFPMVLEKAEQEREPFLLAQYLIDLGKKFNRFYTVHRILDVEHDLVQARISLVSATADVMKTGMALLGLPLPDRM